MEIGIEMRWQVETERKNDIVALKSVDCRKLNVKESLKLAMKLSVKVGIEGKSNWNWVKMVKWNEDDRDNKLESKRVEREKSQGSAGCP